MKKSIRIMIALFNFMFIVMLANRVTVYAHDAFVMKSNIKNYEIAVFNRYFDGGHLPKAYVYNDEHVLVENTDYEVDWYADFEKGIGRVYVKGIGNYCSVNINTFELENIGENLSKYASSSDFLGIPYVWGGTSKNGFDCSGFVQYIYKQYGYSLSRTTYAQSKEGTWISSKEDLIPGDLVFFSNFGHVGIYIGNNMFVHASNSGIKITEIGNDPIDGTYYNKCYCGATRII